MDKVIAINVLLAGSIIYFPPRVIFVHLCGFSVMMAKVMINVMSLRLADKNSAKTARLLYPNFYRITGRIYRVVLLQREWLKQIAGCPIKNMFIRCWKLGFFRAY